MTVVNLIETVPATIRRRDLLPLGTNLVVGVSGGTDSLALLHLLISLRERLDVTLHVATLDHGLRGELGAADARFVAETARAWGVPVTAGSADVRALAAERGLGIEAAARIARYDFLASVARQTGASRIAVAHHADDQVETVLLHLLRGSGLVGLAGMDYAAPLSGHPHLTLIRPLLNVTRADLEAYCRENGLQPRHDATNQDTSYTRNRLRAETLPSLRGLAPQFDRRLLQLAEIAALEDDFADKALHDAIDSRVIREEGRIALPRAQFLDLHPALQRRFVVWVARNLGADDVGYVHITAAVALALHGEVGGRAQLKGGIQLRVDYGVLVVERENASALIEDRPFLAADAVLQVVIPGVKPLGNHWALEASFEPLEQPDVRLALPEGAVVILRGRRNGDRFAPLGMGGHTQKLSKWMSDRKIPRDLRDRIPLLVINGEVAAIYWMTWTIGQQFAVTPNSPRVVYFRLQRRAENE